jgi:hypothetical protein
MPTGFPSRSGPTCANSSPGSRSGAASAPTCRPAAAKRPQQDAHRAGRHRAGRRCPAPRRARAAVVSLGGELGRRAGEPTPGPAAGGRPCHPSPGPRRAGAGRQRRPQGRPPHRPRGRQYLGSLGKTDNGIVAVTSLWADERVYWPVDVVPYTRRPGWPGASAIRRSGPSRSWPSSSSKRPARPGSGSARWWPTASTATTRASPRRWAGPAWPTCWRSSPARASGRRPGEAHTPREAAAELAWTSPEQPGDWTPVTRRFRDGHTQTWWAGDAKLPAAGWGPDRRIRLVRLYSLRNWVEQGYKQVKRELGWADSQVRSA